MGHCSDLMKNMQKITQRAGSVIIFSRELPHGITANVSEDKVRYAQYLRLGPESTLMLTEEEKEERKKCVREMLPKELLESEDHIVREVYMLGK